MAKFPPFAAHANSPQAPVVPLERTLFGMRFRDVGIIEHRSRKFLVGEKFWGYEADGASVYSVGYNIAFVEPNGDVHGVRFVAGQGWCNSDDAVRKALDKYLPLRRVRRSRNFFKDLLAAHDDVRWEPATIVPYPSLKLDASGTALVNGQSLAVGASPAALPGGLFVSQTGQTVHVADDEGVRDRYRFVDNDWQRLVQRRRAAWAELARGAVGDAQGDIMLTAAGILTLFLLRGSTWTINLSGGRTLCRYQVNSTIIAISATAGVEEFAVEGEILWRVEGARDWWSYEPAGVPGAVGETPVLSKEILPGLTIFHNGKLEVANRTYLGGEPIDVRYGAVSVHRKAGMSEPGFVSAGGVVTGLVYSAAGDWWKMTSVSPDQQRFSWRRLLNQQNPLDAWTAHADRAIGETPVLRTAGVVVAALWRLLLAVSRMPVLGPFSLCFMAMYFLLHFLRAALLVISMPVNLLWRAYRRVRRSLELNAR